ncbi:hypothetical protein DLAC_06339 [Tieghemostelium lacteum]|uniref:Uncharacterized protein n=1 Tax=Tieghemostelium lacteum TaxID=361077 RepID=A0A151ZEI2_TIELA|nr:hypothetical protein DLAC_06339 [Tieghemostelium lacteum]|eukprot:KYQ92372.1 hypothetical protein DLAC_06339 [Tieghemostelium lacteum]
MSYILYQQVFKNKYLHGKIFYYVKKYYRDNYLNSFSYNKIPLSYFIQKSENVNTSKLSLLKDKVKSHNEWYIRGDINGIMGYSNEEITAFYNNNTDLETFVLLLPVLKHNRFINNYTVKNIIFSSPSYRIIEYILENRILSSFEPFNLMEKDIHPDLNFEQFLKKHQHIFFHPKYELNLVQLLRRSLLSSSAQNLKYVFGLLEGTGIGNEISKNEWVYMLTPMMEIGNLEVFKLLLNNQPGKNIEFFPKDLKSKNTFSNDHFEIVKLFHQHFNIKTYYSIYSITFILSSIDTNVLEYLSTFESFRDELLLNTSWLSTLISIPSLKYIISNQLMGQKQSLIVRNPKIVTDLELFKLCLPIIKTYVCYSLVNSTSLEILELALTETSVIIDDNELQNAHHSLEILDYLYKMSSLYPDRIKITYKSIEKAFQFCKLDQVQYLYQNHCEFVEGIIYNSIYSRSLERLNYCIGIKRDEISNMIKNNRVNLRSTFHPAKLMNVFPELRKQVNKLASYIQRQSSIIEMTIDDPKSFGIHSFAHRLLLEEAIRDDNLGLLHYLMENRKHPLLKNQIRTNQSCILIDSLVVDNSFKMVLFLFSYDTGGDPVIRIISDTFFEGRYFVYGITPEPIALERNERESENDYIPLSRYDLRAGEMYIVIQQSESVNFTSLSTKFTPNAIAISQYSYPGSSRLCVSTRTSYGSSGAVIPEIRETIEFTGYFISPFDHSGRTQILRIVDANNRDFECSNPIELRGNSDFPSTGSSLKRISCELPGPCRDTTFLFVGQDSNSRGTPFNFYCQDPNIKC